MDAGRWQDGAGLHDPGSGQLAHGAAPFHMPQRGVQLAAAQCTALLQQVDDPFFEGGKGLLVEFAVRVQLHQRVSPLAEAGREHQMNAGAQRGERFFSHPLRQGDLLGREGWLFIHQFLDGLGLADFRSFHPAQNDALGALPAKGHDHQRAWFDGVFQVGGQVVMKGVGDLREVDRNFYIGSHRMILP